MTEITVRHCITAASIVYGLREAVICGETRCRQAVSARHAAWFVAHRIIGHQSTRVARVFRRDHSSVLSGVRIIADKMETDEAIRASVAAVLRIARAAANGQSVSLPDIAHHEERFAFLPSRIKVAANDNSLSSWANFYEA